MTDLNLSAEEKALVQAKLPEFMAMARDPKFNNYCRQALALKTFNFIYNSKERVAALLDQFPYEGNATPDAQTIAAWLEDQAK